MGFNETRTVRLTLNQEPSEGVVAVLSLKDGPADAVEFPGQVEFPAGVTSVEVEIGSREVATEEVKIRAALPFEAGADTDDLEIVIRAE